MAVELRVLEVDADSKVNLRTSQKAATQANAKQTEAQSTDVEEASESTAESDIDSTSTASNKPRISANNASVKRNSASKALANIMDYKINKKNDAAKNETPNNIVNDKSAEESALEENTSTNDVSYDENSDAADVGLHDSNLVTPNENNKD